MADLWIPPSLGLTAVVGWYSVVLSRELEVSLSFWSWSRMSSDNLETEVSFERDFGVRSAADHFTPRPTDREKKTLKTRCRPLKQNPLPSTTVVFRSWATLLRSHSSCPDPGSGGNDDEKNHVYSVVGSNETLSSISDQQVRAPTELWSDVRSDIGPSIEAYWTRLSITQNSLRLLTCSRILDVLP